MIDNKLSQDHIQQLKEGSGLNDEVISARGYRTVNEASELRELGFSRPQCNVPGLLIPVYTTDGSNILVVFRPDTPRVIENRRKRNRDGSFKTHVIKYEMPKGAAMRLDCPPLCRSRLADPDIPLWITEGQKKADALAGRGQCAIDLLGVWNFKGKNQFGGVTWLADWDYIALKGRDIRIVFDSDVMLKPEVRAALDRITEHLQRKGAHVAAVYLPQQDGAKVGVDDYLKTHTLQDLEGLIEGPRPLPAIAAPQMELLQDEPLTIRRPISLVNGRAYAAIWPYVRVTTTEEKGPDGNIIKYEQPITVEEQRLLIIREDGLTFGEGGFEPFEKLGIKIVLPEIPPDDRIWTTKGIIAFRSGQRPDPGNVFKRIADSVDRFIDFDRCFASQRTMAEMVSCFILASWFLDAFNVIGYLWPNGEKGSGKTQLLMLVAELSYLGQVVLSGGSYASLRDMADYGATLAFDDAENIADPNNKNDADKRALLLAGNRRGNKIPVKEPVPNKPWRTRYVHTFCPRLFSAIDIPDPVLASRTILIPLVRTADRYRANADVLDFDLWPHKKQKLIDDCWALALSHLGEMRKYESLVNEKADLTGRALEPWRAILAVAAWLTEKGVSGLWKRIHDVSLAYQGERREIESVDFTPLIIRSLQELIESRGDVLTLSDVFMENTPLLFLTKEITEVAKRIAEDEELGIDPDTLNSRRIGWILKRLRFVHRRQNKTGQKGWIVTWLELQKYLIAFNLPLPEKTSLNVKTSPLAEENRVERFTI